MEQLKLNDFIRLVVTLFFTIYPNEKLEHEA